MSRGRGRRGRCLRPEERVWRLGERVVAFSDVPWWRLPGTDFLRCGFNVRARRTDSLALVVALAVDAPDLELLLKWSTDDDEFDAQTPRRAVGGLSSQGRVVVMGGSLKEGRRALSLGRFWVCLGSAALGARASVSREIFLGSWESFLERWSVRVCVCVAFLS